MPVKQISLNLPGFQDGTNSQLPSVLVGRAYKDGTRLQCTSTRDTMLKGSSIKRRPGMIGLNYSIANRMKGLDTYLQRDGQDTLLTVIGGKLYSISKDAGAATEIYDLGGDGEAWITTYHDKAWVSNGAKNIKVEGSTAYQLAIAPPTGASVAAGGSGTLTAGVYTVFVCYAIKVSGVTRLYSTGQVLGTITLSGTNAAVITCPDSTDPQVTTKIVFMSDLAGSTYYYKGEAAQGVNTITIANDDNKNSALIYDAIAADNTVPPAFSQILAADNRLWGVSGQYVYYSLQAGTVYDLERWGELNYIEFPYAITSIHALGKHLYINTPAGLIRQPLFDVTARFEHVEKRYYFKFPRTVAEWSGTLIGLTEDGIRIFDGEKMSSYDASLDVKEEIQKAYNGSSGADHKPCGAIYRRQFRTEYHFGYRDLNISSRVNNRRMVLNLDKFSPMPDNSVIAPWEFWTAGANYMAVDSDGAMFNGQSGAELSVIYRENSLRAADLNIYVGDTFTAESVPSLQVITGTYILSLSGKVRWQDVRILAQLAEEMSIEVHILAYPTQQTTQKVYPLTSTVDVSRFGIARFGVDRFAPATPTHKVAKLPRNINGYAVYFVFNQALEDKNFEILQMEATGILTSSRFT